MNITSSRKLIFCLFLGLPVATCLFLVYEDADHAAYADVCPTPCPTMYYVEDHYLDVIPANWGVHSHPERTLSFVPGYGREDACVDLVELTEEGKLRVRWRKPHSGCLVYGCTQQWEYCEEIFAASDGVIVREDMYAVNWVPPQIEEVAPGRWERQ